MRAQPAVLVGLLASAISWSTKPQNAEDRVFHSNCHCAVPSRTDVVWRYAGDERASSTLRDVTTICSSRFKRQPPSIGLKEELSSRYASSICAAEKCLSIRCHDVLRTT